MANAVLPRVQAMVLCDAVEDSAQESRVYDLTGVRVSSVRRSEGTTSEF